MSEHRNSTWNTLRSQLDALPALADEWKEGSAEAFVQNLHQLVSRKRSERIAALELARAIKNVHILHEDLLVFFGIEEAFLSWSVARCATDKFDEVRLALTEWREILQDCSGEFPGSGETCQSYASMRVFAKNAQAAAKPILAGFRLLNAYLSPQAVDCEDLEAQAA